MKKSLALTGAVLIFSLAQVSYATTQESADASFAAQNWEEAITSYESLLGADDTNAQNWFRLGSAHHQLGEHAKARTAYKKAREHGFQRPGLINVRLARIHMSLGETNAALSELEEAAETGGAYGRSLPGVAEFEPLLDNARFEQAVKTLTPCSDDVYRAFDFWLGEWDVQSAGNAAPTATNRISSRDGGCLILEEYETAGGFTGTSMNFYDSNKEKWHQSWMSSSGGALYLEGNLTKDGAMQLTDAHMDISRITGTINRVTWTPDEKGGVRQYWESSTDGGETWSVSFDGYYTRKSEEDAGATD